MLVYYISKKCKTQSNNNHSLKTISPIRVYIGVKDSYLVNTHTIVKKDLIQKLIINNCHI